MGGDVVQAAGPTTVEAILSWMMRAPASRCRLKDIMVVARSTLFRYMALRVFHSEGVQDTELICMCMGASVVSGCPDRNDIPSAFVYDGPVNGIRWE